MEKPERFKNLPQAVQDEIQKQIQLAAAERGEMELIARQERESLASLLVEKIRHRFPDLPDFSVEIWRLLVIIKNAANEPILWLQPEVATTWWDDPNTGERKKSDDFEEFYWLLGKCPQCGHPRHYEKSVRNLYEIAERILQGKFSDECDGCAIIAAEKWKTDQETRKKLEFNQWGMAQDLQDEIQSIINYMGRTEDSNMDSDQRLATNRLLLSIASIMAAQLKIQLATYIKESLKQEG